MTPKIDGNSLRAEGQCPWSYRLYSGIIGISLDHRNGVYVHLAAHAEVQKSEINLSLGEVQHFLPI